VIERAARETKLRPGAVLHLLHVIQAPVPGLLVPSERDLANAVLDARAELEQSVRASSVGPIEIVGHVRIGGLVDEIVGLAEEANAELVVIGTGHHSHAMRLLLGSTTRALLKRAPCSVLFARPPAVPEIDPPRPDQDADIHRRHHPRAHTYWEAESENAHFADGSMNFRL
jgi:nucleotide-binding universal stress UspA family protein